VSLVVNGQVLRQDTPPQQNPATFRVVQTWTPTSEGAVTVSVIAYDVHGLSGQASINLQVVASGAVLPTAVLKEPAETPPPPVTTEAGCTLDSRYMADVTIPDGTELGVGAAFVKTWKVQNSGTCDWDAGYQLLYVSGDQMGGPASVSLPAVPAGSQIDISVNLIASPSYGMHKGTWRIRSDEGTLFGTNLTVVISIPAAATGTPLPTVASTSLPSPTPQPTGVPTEVPTLPPPPTPEPTTAVPFTEMATWHATVAGGGTMDIGATCPAGTVVVGGGFMSSAEVVFVAQYKDGNAWTVKATNTAASGREVYAYAVCLHNAAGATTSQVESQVTVPGSGLKQAIVTCPSGSVATAGGWKGQDVNVRVYASVRSANAWYIEARNESGSAKSLKVYAVCLSGNGAAATEIGTGESVPGNGTGKAILTCPAGTVLSGGGFGVSSSGQLVVHGASGPWGTDRQWRVYVTNTSGSSQTFHGRAVCLSLPVP
jgi:hypothetical protein